MSLIVEPKKSEMRPRVIRRVLRAHKRPPKRVKSCFVVTAYNVRPITSAAVMKAT